MGELMARPLTAEEAATELGYNLRHFYRLLKSGKVQGERVGPIWLIDREEVERVRSLQSAKGRLPRRSSLPRRGKQ